MYNYFAKGYQINCSVRRKQALLNLLTVNAIFPEQAFLFCSRYAENQLFRR